MITEQLPNFETAMKLLTEGDSSKDVLALQNQKVRAPRKTRLEWNTLEKGILFQKHMDLGNKWTTISKYLPNKTENIIKNFFYSSLRKLSRKVRKGAPLRLEDTTLTYEQCNHLLEYLEEVITENTGTVNSKRKDTYIMEMYSTKELTKEKIDYFRKNLKTCFSAEEPKKKLAVITNFLDKYPELVNVHKEIQSKLAEVYNYLSLREGYGAMKPYVAHMANIRVPFPHANAIDLFQMINK